MRRRLLILLGLFLGFSLSGMAQKEVRQWVRKGNKYYQDQKYDKAELEYRKALEAAPKDAEVNYNLANTLYRTERGEEAGKIYQELLKEVKLLPKERAADLTHNAGNLAMAAKDYATAVEMYKESLRNRPTDDETRYNLALAQKLLEQQQQDGGDDQDEQNQDEQQDQQQQDQQQQSNPEQDQQQDQQQNKPQEQPAPNETMSQDNAEKILEAYLQEEKETQKKVEQMKQQQQKGKKSRPKNW